MEMQLVWMAVSLVAILLLAWASRRARELFVLQVEGGRTQVTRGRPPHALLQDLADVFARAGVAAATVKVLREGGRPRLVAEGLDPATLQRARNVVGAFPAHKLVGSKG